MWTTVSSSPFEFHSIMICCSSRTLLFTWLVLNLSARLANSTRISRLLHNRDNRILQLTLLADSLPSSNFITTNNKSTRNKRRLTVKSELRKHRIRRTRVGDLKIRASKLDTGKRRTRCPTRDPWCVEHYRRKILRNTFWFSNLFRNT